MENIATLVLEDSVAITIDGETRSVNDSHIAYELIRDAIRKKDFKSIPTLLDTKTAVADYITNADDSRVSIEDVHGRLVIKYDGDELKNSVTSRIALMMRDKFDATPMINFLENLMLNTSKRAADDLLDWLEAGSMPITEDGYILAYKNVNDDFTSMHSNPDGTSLDNSVGKVIEMPRNQVDENPEETCSTGLHFCAQSYLPSFGGDSGKTIILKIHPRDVVAFPKDYNLAKGRACRYEVVGVHEKGCKTSAFDNELVDTEWDVEVEVEASNIEDTESNDREKILGTGKGDIVSVEEAAKYFDCTVSAVRKRCKRGSSARWAGHNKVEIL